MRGDEAISYVSPHPFSSFLFLCLGTWRRGGGEDKNLFTLLGMSLNFFCGFCGFSIVVLRMAGVQILSPRRSNCGTLLLPLLSHLWQLESLFQGWLSSGEVVLVGQPRKPTVPWYSQMLLGHASYAIAASPSCPKASLQPRNILLTGTSDRSLSVILSKCFTWLRREEAK